jgi:hypothetical protein
MVHTMVKKTIVKISIDILMTPFIGRRFWFFGAGLRPLVGAVRGRRHAEFQRHTAAAAGGAPLTVKKKWQSWSQLP